MAYDAIETPFGKTGRILGGCATYIGLAASQFDTQCGLVSVIGDDFEDTHIDLLKGVGLDFPERKKILNSSRIKILN